MTNVFDDADLVGGRPDIEVFVRFQIQGATLSSEEISALLELQPTHSHSVDDDRSEDSDRTRSTGIWCLEGELAPTEKLDVQVKALLKKLSGKAQALATVSEKGHEIVMLCTWTSCGDYMHSITLDNDLVSGLDALSARLDIEFERV